MNTVVRIDFALLIFLNPLCFFFGGGGPSQNVIVFSFMLIGDSNLQYATAILNCIAQSFIYTSKFTYVTGKFTLFFIIILQITTESQNVL